MAEKKIREKDFIRIRKKFIRYVRTFRAITKDHKKNYSLKKYHTFRVINEILYIGKKLGLNKEELLTAKITALLHDIGRFEQYCQYRTFVDFQSVDHALLGLKVIKKLKLLFGLNAGIQKTICSVIQYHNYAELPPHVPEKTLFFTRLLRDADKVDILKVCSEYYNRKYRSENQAIELGLPDNDRVSPEIFRILLKKGVVRSKQLKTVNDFKLMQIAWIYDINFFPAFLKVKKKHYLERIYRVLPQTEKIKKIYQATEEFINRKIKEAL